MCSVVNVKFNTNKPALDKAIFIIFMLLANCTVNYQLITHHTFSIGNGKTRFLSYPLGLARSLPLQSQLFLFRFIWGNETTLQHPYC